LTTTITSGHLSASIKHLGAELFSFKKTDIDTEYIWEGDAAFWAKHSPVLFPIVGTLKNNTYHYNGIDYSLPRHGFARDNNFERINKTANSATFSLQASENSLLVYPFNFELQIKYTVENNSLTIMYTIINAGNSKLPFSIGAHPAIALPGNFEDYALEFEKEEVLSYHLLENDLIADTKESLSAHKKVVDLNYELFKNDALIFKKLDSKTITILKNNIPYLKAHYPNFPHLGIWTKINAPFICIEPWFGYSDTIYSTGNLFEKEGMQLLEPHSSFNASFSLEIT
jgi:galactose mutarotase-like enzyme